MSHAGMTAEQAEIYKMQFGSYVKPVTTEQVRALRESSGDGLLACKRAAEKQNMLDAIEAVRWECGADYNSAMHTVLDVLQYLVERT